MEVLELVELLADRGELDRLAGDGLDRQRSAAARVAVQLGQEEPVEGDAFVEGLGDVDRLLAGHRVEDEEDVRRLERVADLGQLLHQLLVDLEAPGGIDDHRVATLRSGLLDTSARGRDRIGAVVAVDWDLDLAAELLELVDGGGALEVGGDERRRAALLAQEQSELGGGGRLPRALEADEEDDGRRAPG